MTRQHRLVQVLVIGFEFILLFTLVGMLWAIDIPVSSINVTPEAITSGELAGEPQPTTVQDMEAAAKKAAEKYKIHDRVTALTESWPSQQRTLTVQVPLRAELFGSSDPADVTLQSGHDDRVQIHIRGNLVYEQAGVDIRVYLGMGKWEYLLDHIETDIAVRREEWFRIQRVKRFGPLQGWGLNDQ